MIIWALTTTTPDKAMDGDIGLKLESTGTDLRTLAKPTFGGNPFPDFPAADAGLLVGTAS